MEITEVKRIYKEPQSGSNGHNEPIMSEKDLKLLLNGAYPVIYRGPAGVGKTSSLIFWGLANGYDCYVQECASDMMASDLTGKWSIINGETVFLVGEIGSALHNSMKKKTLLILDEVNLLSPAVLKGIGSVLDFRLALNTDVGRIEGNDANICIAGTMNAEPDSAGFDLDPALRSRCIVTDVDYGAIFKNLAKKHPIDTKWVQIMTATQAKFSLRELHQLQVLTDIGFTADEAYKYVLTKYSAEDKGIIDNMRTTVGV